VGLRIGPTWGLSADGNITPQRRKKDTIDHDILIDHITRVWHWPECTQLAVVIFCWSHAICRLVWCALSVGQLSVRCSIRQHAWPTALCYVHLAGRQRCCSSQSAPTSVCWSFDWALVYCYIISSCVDDVSQWFWGTACSSVQPRWSNLIWHQSQWEKVPMLGIVVRSVVPFWE